MAGCVVRGRWRDKISRTDGEGAGQQTAARAGSDAGRFRGTPHHSVSPTGWMRSRHTAENPLLDFPVTDVNHSAPWIDRPATWARGASHHHS